MIRPASHPDLPVRGPPTRRVTSSHGDLATRYSHMPDELRHEYAGQVGDLLWAAEEVADGQLGNDHRDALQQLAATLPEPWRTRVTELLRPDDDDGLSGALVPA